MKGRDYMSKKPKTITIDDGVRSFGKMAQVGGAFTERQAKEHLTDYQFDEFKRLNMLRYSDVRVSKKQLFKLADENAISKTELYEKLKEKVPTIRIHSFSDKGRRFEDKALGLKHAHHSNSKLHDVFLSAKHNSLSAEAQASAKPEGEIRAELRTAINDLRKNNPERLEEILNRCEDRLEGFIEKFEKEGGYASPVDMAYYSSSTESYVSYEVVTRHYKSYDIVCKEFCSEVLNYQHEVYRV